MIASLLILSIALNIVLGIRAFWKPKAQTPKRQAPYKKHTGVARKGRVVTVEGKPKPVIRKRGGHVVKVLPKQIKRMKRMQNGL